MFCVCVRVCVWVCEWMLSSCAALQMEGVAYRGRILVEIGMDMGRLPTHQKQKISQKKVEV